MCLCVFFRCTWITQTTSQVQKYRETSHKRLYWVKHTSRCGDPSVLKVHIKCSGTLPKLSFLWQRQHEVCLSVSRLSGCEEWRHIKTRVCSVVVYRERSVLQHIILKHTHTSFNTYCNIITSSALYFKSALWRNLVSLFLCIFCYSPLRIIFITCMRETFFYSGCTMS